MPSRARTVEPAKTHALLGSTAPVLPRWRVQPGCLPIGRQLSAALRRALCTCSQHSKESLSLTAPVKLHSLPRSRDVTGAKSCVTSRSKGCATKRHPHVVQLDLEACRAGPEAGIRVCDIFADRTTGQAERVCDHIRPRSEHTGKPHAFTLLVLANALLAEEKLSPLLLKDP